MNNRKRLELSFGARKFALGTRTLACGLVEVSAGKDREVLSAEAAYALATEMEEAGADLIEIVPQAFVAGAARIDAAEEWRRAGAVLKRLKGRLTIPVIYLTDRAENVQRALELGVEGIHDPFGLTTEPQIAAMVRDADAAFIVGHMRGQPEFWPKLAPLADAVTTITADLDAALGRARRANILPKSLIADPGFGWGKRKEQNLEMLAELARIASLEVPVIVSLPDMPAAAAAVAAAYAGVMIVRARAVAEVRAALDLADAILNHRDRKASDEAEAAEEAATKTRSLRDKPGTRSERPKRAPEFNEPKRVRPVVPPIAAAAPAEPPSPEIEGPSFVGEPPIEQAAAAPQGESAPQEEPRREFRPRTTGPKKFGEREGGFRPPQRGRSFDGPPRGRGFDGPPRGRGYDGPPREDRGQRPYGRPYGRSEEGPDRPPFERGKPGGFRPRPPFESREGDGPRKSYGPPKFGEKKFGEKKFGPPKFGDRKAGGGSFGPKKFGPPKFGKKFEKTFDGPRSEEGSAGESGPKRSYSKPFGSKPSGLGGPRKFGSGGPRKFGTDGSRKFGTDGPKKFGAGGPRKFGAGGTGRSFDKPDGQKQFGPKPFGPKKFSGPREDAGSEGKGGFRAGPREGGPKSFRSGGTAGPSFRKPGGGAGKFRSGPKGPGSQKSSTRPPRRPRSGD